MQITHTKDDVKILETDDPAKPLAAIGGAFAEVAGSRMCDSGTDSWRSAE